MILRVELPKTNMAIEGAIVEKWHKEVGQPVEHGEVLVDLVVDKVTRLQRKPASKLFNRARQEEARYFAVKGGGFRIRVLSLDSGALLGIDAPEGALVSEGSILGTIRSNSHSSAGSEDSESVAVARVVVNRVEANTE